MGGNIFDFASSIKREDIEPTIKEFYKELGRIFPKAKKYFKDIKTLGSVGKKDISGDIDLALSGKSLMRLEDWDLNRQKVLEDYKKFKKRARTATNRQLIKRAIITSLLEKISKSSNMIVPDSRRTGSGSFHVAFPQFDKEENQLDISVQIDVNVGDLDWLEFSYYSEGDKDGIKGLHRTQLIIALFSQKGYTFSHNQGVKNKETKEIVAINPKQAIEFLSKLYNIEFIRSSLTSYFKIMDLIRNNLSNQELHNIFDIYLRILDKTRTDIPPDLQNYWINNQKRLGLTGKFLPDTSKLLKYKTV